MHQLQKVMSYVRRALDDYHMIKENDTVAVGVSAGKDSLTLLAALAEMRRFYPVRYGLKAITIDVGFPGGTDFSPIAAFCNKLGVEYTVVPTDIYQVVFDIRKEENPCSLCAKMRRGALHSAAREAGCNRVALGHHFDDVVDTFCLNLFYEGRLGCFRPVTYLSRSDLFLIRPLLYMPEKEIVYFANQAGLPVIRSKCPADGATERETVHQTVNELDRQFKGIRQKIFSALQSSGLDGFSLDPHEPEDSPGD